MAHSGAVFSIDLKKIDPLRHNVVFYDGRIVPFPYHGFDVCYSNSVIEHVGDADAVAPFASEVKRLAPRYYVHTPNRYFFVEPYFLGVFAHWFPMRLKRRLVRRFTHMLTVTEMRRLFPNAEIVHQRFLDLTKSTIAMKRN
jgi:hypothetical protein